VDSRVELIVRESLAHPRLAINGTPDAAELERYVSQLIGEDWLDRQVAEYRDWAFANSDPVIVAKTLPLLPNVNYLVPRIWATRFWLSDPSTWPGPPAGAIRLSELAVSLAAVELLGADLFDSRARKHWSDRVRDINGVWAVVHEASDFVHFARQRIEVIPRFLVPASREELILRLKQGEFAVECKAIRPGTGRKIKAEHFKRFADIVLADLARSNLRWSVRIAFDGDLGESDLGPLFHHVHDRIVRRRSGVMQFEQSGRPITIELSSIPTTVITEQTMGSVAAEYDYHLVLIATEPNVNGEQQIRGVIGFDSSPTDRPWRSLSLRDAIDAAAVQLQGRGPGLVSVHFFDYVENLESRRPGPFSLSRKDQTASPTRGRHGVMRS